MTGPLHTQSDTSAQAAPSATTATHPAPHLSPTADRRAQLLQTARTLFVGGVLPVIAFALVEEWYGTVGGLIAGVAFGVGEIIYEYVTLKKVQTVTLAGNALVIILGGISLFESDPVMFKLQPALLLFAFAVFILGSSALKKPFLVEMSKKQMPQFNPEQNPEQWQHIQKTLGGLNTRFGFALIGLALLSTYAAYEWSTAAWAFLKGIGAPLILFIYIGIEVWLMRRRQRQRR